ncbi:hypothetical protein VBD025_14605 [Virgibacillus flavescens]|uniref:hypothetical protein n=1 Tax=Virgibacillus flavescens TaxID=1611422 RepID=UPI003D334B61
MFKFISNHIHWILLFFVIVNLLTSFINFNNSKQDSAAIIFGLIALFSVTYLFYHIEAKKRKEKNEKASQ